MFDIKLSEATKEEVFLFVDDWLSLGFKVHGDMKIIDESFCHAFGTEKGFSFERNYTLELIECVDIDNCDEVNRRVVTASLFAECEEFIFSTLSDVYLKDM